MNQERLLKIFLSPIVSEKTTMIGDKYNQYAVVVDKKATKFEIKKAAERLFKVKVEKVNVLNVKSKVKYFNRRKGVVSGYKKAYLKLFPGNEINFSEVGKG